jgi:hypothetical protein
VASKLVRRAHETLIKNRSDAIALVQDLGIDETRKILNDSVADLKKRIAARVKAGTGETFTLTQLRTTLAQVQEVTKDLVVNMRDNILDVGGHAAEHAAEHTIEYLVSADKAFRGVGVQPLALREATMLEEASQGVSASILRRLASSGEPLEDADDEEHPAKMGILERYGVDTIAVFERELQRGLITRKSWPQMARDITEKSPFLQGAPAYWADRIVRTEVMGAYGRASWETIREADQQLEDMSKIWSETFDERTAADSYACHGQIRRPEETFETWYGLAQFPPMRPNDRAIIVPHRVSWPIPPYLQWKTDAQVFQRWRYEGRKGAPPERPEMTTIELSLFGKQEPPKLEDGD